MIDEGDKIANFELSGIDENGEERLYTSKDFCGKKFVLYFYPKDNTSGCTTEACDFRDNMERVADKVTVVGVSPDSIKSHVKFRDKHGLNFPLLSDPDKTLSEPLGAYGEKKMCGRVSMGIIRSTFLIDEKGVIKKAWRKVKVKGHVDDVLAAV